MSADAQHGTRCGQRGSGPSQGVPVRTIRPASSNHADGPGGAECPARHDVGRPMNTQRHATDANQAGHDRGHGKDVRLLNEARARAGDECSERQVDDRRNAGMTTGKAQPLRCHFCECGIGAQPLKGSLHQVDHDRPRDHGAPHERRHRSGAYKGEIDHGDQREKRQQHRAAQRTHVAHDIDQMGMIDSQCLRTVQEIQVKAARVTFEYFAAEFREHQQQKQDCRTDQQGLQQSPVRAETKKAFRHGVGVDSGGCSPPREKAGPCFTGHLSRSRCLCDDVRNESGRAATPVRDLTRRLRGS